MPSRRRPRPPVPAAPSARPARAARGRRPQGWQAVLAVVGAVAAIGLGGTVVTGTDDGAPLRAPASSSSDGMPTVPASALPVEAREVLSLIEDGGPFPYDQDGSTFQNREGELPPQDRGCYREYTVETPGERDRGARRIVTSCTGEEYWTEDHYDSFARITGATL